MIKKAKTPLKTSVFMKAGLLVTVFAVLFFNFTNSVSYAQYYQPNYNNYPNPYNYTPIYITTIDATNITGINVTLNGLVNGSALYSTYNVETWFQYGTDTNVSLSTAHNYSNSGYANYSSNVANLTPNTTYYFRAMAQTPQGLVYGNINSFRTNYANVVNYSYNNPTNYYPTVTQTNAITEPATYVSVTSVELNSLILNSTNDGSGSTWFEYNTNQNLNKTTAIKSIGGLPSVKHVSTLTGLSPATTYYFRAVVANSTGVVNGNVLSFTTGGVRQNTQTTTVITSTDTITPQPNNTSTNINGGVLGANALGSNYLFPNNIFGWMVLLIFVLILILLIKNPQNRFWKTRTEETHS